VTGYLKKLSNEIYDTSYFDRSLIIRAKRLLVNKFNYPKFNHDKQYQSSSISGAFGVNYDIPTVLGTTEDSKSQKQKKNAYNSGYSLPWIDKSLWSEINRSNPNSLPKRIITPDRSSVESKDLSTLESYSGSNRRIRRRILPFLTKSGIIAATDIWNYDVNKTAFRKPLSVSDSVESLIKPTNAGAPTMRKKNANSVVRETILSMRNLLRSPIGIKFITSNVSKRYFHVSNSLEALYQLPEVIFHRFQPALTPGSKVVENKSRVVWCVPFIIVAFENYFLGNVIHRAILKSQTDNISIYPTGLNNLSIGRKSVNSLRNKFLSLEKSSFLSNSKRSIYSLDFSKFDSTIDNIFKDIFFCLIRKELILTSNESKIFDYLRTYIKYSPYIYKGEFRIKNKGISSGLLITNLFDSFVNLMLIYMTDQLCQKYFDIAVGLIDSQINLLDVTSLCEDDLPIPDFRRSCSRILGDDALVVWSSFELLVHELICKTLGLNVTIKHKTDSSFNDIFFLGRYWKPDGLPYQSELYMSSHIVIRTKRYDLNLLPFDVEKLDLFRVLSICLPLGNGKSYLDKTFKDWKPYKEFLTEGSGFNYLKDFPDSEYAFIPFSESLNPENY
jgi:hypothetical protein